MTVLEGSIEEKETLLCDPDIFQDHERVQTLNDELTIAKEEMDVLLEEWTELEELVEE